MSNIFLLHSGLGVEDRFTAGWHYLIDSYPDIGQAVVDVLLQAAGHRSATFLHAEDHPVGTSEDRPDFLLHCDTIDIICEHKLASPLGHRQLQRYLALPRPRPFVVALITNSACVIPPEVLATPAYLRPVAGQVPYTRWQDVYPIIAAHPSRLARDFAAYMRTLGMQPWTVEEWTGLFTDATTARAWHEQWSDVRAFFAQRGASCRRDVDYRGLQVQQLYPWLQLVYFDIAEAAVPPEQRLDGPFVRARVYVKIDSPAVALSDAPMEELQIGGVRLVTRPHAAIHEWEDVHRVYEYLTPLLPLLTRDSVELRRRLLLVARAVDGHLHSLYGAISSHSEVKPHVM